MRPAVAYGADEVEHDDDDADEDEDGSEDTDDDDDDVAGEDKGARDGPTEDGSSALHCNADDCWRILRPRIRISAANARASTTVPL